MMGIILASCSKREGRYMDYYPTGQKKIEINYVNGLKEGPCIVSNEDGSRLFSAEFEKGLLTGRLLEHFPNGSPKMDVSFVKGKMEGYYFLRFSNGVAVEKGYSKGGVKEGIVFKFYENGRKWSSSFFQNQKQIGKFQTWFESGIPLFEYNYIDGLPRGEAYWYHEDLSLAFSGVFNNGILYKQNDSVPWSGEIVCNDSLGNTALRGQYIAGKAAGDWKVYYRNGQVYLEGRFENGRKDGIWTKYDANGNVALKDEYAEGLQVYDYAREALEVIEKYERKAKPASDGK